MYLFVLIPIFVINSANSVKLENFIPSDEHLEVVSKTAKTWTVGIPTFPETVTFQDFHRMGGILDFHSDPTFKKVKELKIQQFDGVKPEIPVSFDSRTRWPQCEDVIGNIRYQGICSSCYAFASAEMMSDRLCISTNGTVKFTFSTEEIVSCCSSCGNGCNGGTMFEPLVYWNTTGVPSGGDQNSNLGCKPYTAEGTMVTPICTNSCVAGYDKDLNSDRKYSLSPYYVNDAVEDIQLEIMTYGPVEAYFALYFDFYVYVGGIFNSTMEDFVGGHSVKIIGWDEEDGVPYWIVANSWSDVWGENGYFRVVRGENNCNIEEGVIAARFA